MCLHALTALTNTLAAAADEEQLAKRRLFEDVLAMQRAKVLL
mgnify:CR=1 FL=1